MDWGIVLCTRDKSPTQETTRTGGKYISFDIQESLISLFATGIWNMDNHINSSIYR